MSNEKRFDDRVKRMFQAESVAPPAELEERLFSQLRPSPWPKRLGLSVAVVLISLVGWQGLVSETEGSDAPANQESMPDANHEVVTLAAPERQNASIEAVPPVEELPLGEAEQEFLSVEEYDSAIFEEKHLTHSERKTPILLQALDRVPIATIVEDDFEALELQEKPNEWVLPAVVKLKN